MLPRRVSIPNRILIGRALPGEITKNLTTIHTNLRSQNTSLAVNVVEM